VPTGFRRAHLVEWVARGTLKVGPKRLTATHAVQIDPLVLSAHSGSALLFASGKSVSSVRRSPGEPCSEVRPLLNQMGLAGRPGSCTETFG